MAVDRGNAVGLEQTGNTHGQLADDTRLPLHHLANVDLHIAQLNALVRIAVLCLFIFVGNFQQGLGRNTAYVQTGTTEHLLFAVFGSPGFYARGFETQLGRLDRSHVTTRACANDDYIVIVRHVLSRFLAETPAGVLASGASV